jgi:hypothetical protein
LERLEPTLEKPDPDGRWRSKWRPSDFGLAANQDIEYRARLDDGGPPLTRFESGSSHYRPWWDMAWQDYRPQTLAFAGALSLLLAYLLAIGMMLWLVPARLAGIADANAIGEIEKPEGNLAFSIVLLQRP